MTLIIHPEGTPLPDGHPFKPNFPKKLYLCHARALNPRMIRKLCNAIALVPHIDKRHINSPFIGIITPMNGLKKS